jgi:formylglycine-generating enzyme required for sulfatase activity
MSLKVFKDLVDDATVSTIPESGSFKAVGKNFLSKLAPFSYVQDRLVLADGCGFDVFDGNEWRQVVNRGSLDVLAASLLDVGGTFAVGNDYFIYICIGENGEPEIIISANSTVPAGYTSQTSRKIGGFHYGHIRKVSDDGLWVPIDSNGVKYGTSGTKWEDNVTVGIVPNSVWDLANRPKCSPEGMVKVGKLWVDIYQASAAEAITLEGSGLSVKTGKLQSKYGQLPVTGTEQLNWYGFAELAALIEKKMLSYAEWIGAARGNPQGENAGDKYGWTKTTNTARTRTGCGVDSTTGAFIGEAGLKPFAVSAFNIVDAVGNVYEWLDEFTYREDGTTPGWAYRDVLGAGKGQAYLYKDNALVALRAGGSWNRGVYAGSRTVDASNYPWYVYADNGCRLACDAA